MQQRERSIPEAEGDKTGGDERKEFDKILVRGDNVVHVAPE